STFQRNRPKPPRARSYRHRRPERPRPRTRSARWARPPIAAPDTSLGSRSSPGHIRMMTRAGETALPPACPHRPNGVVRVTVLVSADTETADAWLFMLPTDWLTPTTPELPLIEFAMRSNLTVATSVTLLFVLTWPSADSDRANCDPRPTDSATR